MLIDINKIKITDRIRKDFGNIEELANDIQENGLINPPVVTPEYELIAGERRLKACKSLGYQQLEVRIMTVKNALHQLKLEISENENRKDFSFNEKMTWAKLLEEEYKKIAKENSSINLKQNSDMQEFASREKIGSVRNKVANEVGLGSGETYRQAKFVAANATEEMIKDLDDGKLSINGAYIKLKKDKENLENQLKTEQIKQKTNDNTINSLKTQLSTKDKDIEILKRDKSLLERKVKLNEEDAKKFNDLKTQIEFLNKEKEDIARQIQSATELSGLSVKIDNFLKTELSPIRYSRTLERMDSEVAVKNLQDIIESVESWCIDMRVYLPNKYNNKNIIDVEVVR